MIGNESFLEWFSDERTFAWHGFVILLNQILVADHHNPGIVHPGQAVVVVVNPPLKPFSKIAEPLAHRNRDIPAITYNEQHSCIRIPREYPADHAHMRRCFLHPAMLLVGNGVSIPDFRSQPLF